MLIEGKSDNAWLLGTRCWYKALGNAPLESAIKISAENASALYQRGIAYTRTGQKEASENSIAAAIFVDGDIARTYDFYGIVK